MMKVIYKYELGVDGEARIINDNIEKFLHVESQYGIPMVWAEVNLDKASETSWKIFSIGTGWDLPDELMVGLNYVGTVLDGPYVWHYYWRMTPVEVEDEDEDEDEENKEEVVE